MRSVCNIFHAFSANVFVDELAATAAIDPIEYRLALIPESGILKVPGDQPPKGHGLDLARLRHVLERVRDLSEWPRHRPDGTGIGVAVHHSFRSYVATVIEAKVTGNNVKVQNAWVVLDCGTYVNSDSCIAQMEGAVAFGLSLAQTDGITMADGSVDQSNFHDYRVIRMNESPAISVELVASSAAPAGVGEPGVPPIAPALSNAIFNATGRRLRKLPLMLSS
jgi:isoquinoline 1-oxidoreductase beta subunit